MNHQCFPQFPAAGGADQPPSPACPPPLRADGRRGQGEGEGDHHGAPAVRSSASWRRTSPASALPRPPTNSPALTCRSPRAPRRSPSRPREGRLVTRRSTSSWYGSSPLWAPSSASGRVPLDSYALYSALHSMPSAVETLHALASKSSWFGVSCALAASYGGSGRYLGAQRLFNESPAKNRVFGNAVLAAYVGAAKWAPVLGFARRFSELRLPVDGYTMTAVVLACGEVANADLCVQAHGHAIRRLGGIEVDLFLVSAFVDMYAKCGLIPQSERVFGLAQQETGSRGDVVLWTCRMPMHDMDSARR